MLMAVLTTAVGAAPRLRRTPRHPKPRHASPKQTVMLANSAPTTAPTPACPGNPCGDPTACAAAFFTTNRSALSLGPAPNPLIPCCSGGQASCLACVAVLGCSPQFPQCADSSWTALVVAAGRVVVPCEDAAAAVVAEYVDSGSNASCTALADRCAAPYVQKLCPLTCNVCTAADPAASHASCAELAPYCDDELVAASCPSTCGRCPSSDHPPPPATPPPTVPLTAKYCQFTEAGFNVRSNPRRLRSSSACAVNCASQ